MQTSTMLSSMQWMLNRCAVVHCFTAFPLGFYTSALQQMTCVLVYVQSRGPEVGAIAAQGLASLFDNTVRPRLQNGRVSMPSTGSNCLVRDGPP
jgi:hypothetical protein